MSQEQPSSLPHWRTREASVGASKALREAAEEVDTLLDLLGRKRDAAVVALLMSSLWGLILGVGLTLFFQWVRR